MEINEKVLQLKVEEQKLQEELDHGESFIPSGNMGKWGRQVRLDKITEKLKRIQEKIHFHDSIYLSNEIYNEWKKDVE
jgi:glycerol kinase